MPDKLRIIFMGTPDFAVESLRALHDSKHTIVGIITAPDRPAGRGKSIDSSAVKKYAERAGIGPVLQPESLKDPRFLDQLSSLKADLQVVVAFRMLPEIVWAMPPKGTVNLHASLLPDYRGAAPINWAIINGEKETGITTFLIEKEIDTGHILLQEKVAITPEMDAGELHDILMLRGSALLVRTVDAIAAGSISPVPQQSVMNGRPVHQAPKLFKDDCRIDWSKSAIQIHNFIRGLSPYPAAWTELSDNERIISIKIYKSHIESIQHDHPNGTIVSDFKNSLKIAVHDGYVVVDSLQQAGKKRMETNEFLRGFQNLKSYRLKV